MHVLYLLHSSNNHHYHYSLFPYGCVVDNSKQLADPARWDINSRSWRYQTCDQVSYFNTAPKSGSLRAPSVNLEYHLTQCEEVFGKRMFPSSLQMNQKYGGEFPASENVRTTQ
jgi:hypothetical protein